MAAELKPPAGAAYRYPSEEEIDESLIDQGYGAMVQNRKEADRMVKEFSRKVSHAFLSGADEVVLKSGDVELQRIQNPYKITPTT